MNPITLPEDYKYIAALITMRCNLDCSFCLNAFSRSFDRKGYAEISGQEWVEALDRIVPKPNVPVTFSGGEPFLHRDFIYILNNLRNDLGIDILTNLKWGERGLGRFIAEVDPQRIRRDSPYASIRASYHPEQMGDGEELVRFSRRLIDAGFSVGIWAVLYPSPNQLSAINQMQFRCRDAGIDFRVKEFTGEYKGEIYGDYSRYPGAAFSSERRRCSCRTSELILGPNAEVYKCHRDLFNAANPIGNLRSPEFELKGEFIPCGNYGECHPCDVKVKTNHRQALGHTSVKITMDC